MKKFIKRISCAMLCVALTGGMLAGCTSAGNEEKDENKVYKVGICQLVQHDALDKSTQGIKDALAEKLGDNVEIDFQNASGDSTNCSTIANKFVSSQYDLVMAVATPALQACATATASSKIPVVATAITNFGTALDIDMGPTDATGINVTGTHDLAPLEKQAEQLTTLFPDAKKVGILYCSAEANSKFQAEGMTDILKAQGIEVTSYTFVDSNDIQSVTQKAADSSDVLYIPTDNTVASNGSIVDEVCQKAETPIISGETSACIAYNGVATYSIDFYEIGYQAGEMAYEILVNGADPATMNIRAPQKLTAQYNPEMAKKYGVLDIIENDRTYQPIEAE
ncbi:ABC transporter substrate-binding protein [uncultured Eubacterium sp.]|uniref:ABC transporter substrate-binding protein n=1 Tax=uncultured Eubacterium sp. TaxID=165185 RepID=UPI0015B7D1A1|nr:ABC transporter substrate-binding protein [uncultured Eubacterium sp.]